MEDNISELLENLLIRTNKSKSLFIKFVLSTVIILGIGLTIIDLSSNKDLISSNSLINNQDLQFDLRKNELQFRENLIKQKNNSKNELNIELLDSIAKNQTDSKYIRRYILLNKIKNGTTKVDFSTPINTISDLSLLVEFSELKTTYEIDFERLENIIDESENKILSDEILKFGNYINTTHTFEKKIKKEYLIVFAFLIIALLVILYYLNRIGLKTKENHIEETAKNLAKDKQNLKDAKNILEDDKIKESEIKVLKKLIASIEKNIDSYKIDSILESVLFSEVSKSEKKSLELYNRSTLMLILGLIVAIAGIVVFYFTLPEFSSKIEPKNYLALTIRPSLVLIFVQTIAFYLLKQYRSLINDYKYFHNEYSKNSRIFSIFQLIQNEELNDNESKFIDLLMNLENQEIKQEENLENLSIIETLKGLVDKLK